MCGFFEILKIFSNCFLLSIPRIICEIQFVDKAYLKHNSKLDLKLNFFFKLFIFVNILFESTQLGQKFFLDKRRPCKKILLA